MPRTSDLDLFYISYDEPNAEYNWADLLYKAPWAKRIHGVKGFDAAHKKCARNSTTERFITVDGDNIVHEEFFNLQLDTRPGDRTVISWNSDNAINGLVYGNGGIKCWTQSMALKLKSHENADTARADVDFCWEDGYIHSAGVYSTTYCNATEYQAFRAGFREGVKMCLHNGQRVDVNRFWDTVHAGNLTRLLVWCTVGTDVPHGDWAIYGARLGASLTLLDQDFDHRNIRDYDWFSGFFQSKREVELQKAIADIGKSLRSSAGLPIEDLDAAASRFIKQYPNFKRLQ